MFPISQRSHISHCDTTPISAVSPPTQNNCISSQARQVPYLNSPPVYPRDIIYMDLKRFVESGTVPESESMQSCIAQWCLKNRESQALVTLLKNGNIECLDLGGLYLDSDDAEVLAMALKANTMLSQIDLSENYLGSRGLEIICAALEENSSLAALNLTGNAIDASSVVAIGNMLAKNGNLTCLNLSFCKIDANGMGILAKALQENTQLTELSLCFNSFGLDGIGIITKMLEKAAFINILDLSGNDIGPEAGQLIAGMLNTNTTLSKLVLTHNNLGSDGADFILNALKSNSTLRSLSLGENALDGRSAAHIGSLLATNTSLATLDFSENRLCVPCDGLGIEAIDSMVHGLEHNTTVIDLNLTANHPGDKFSTAPPNPLLDWIPQQQRDADIGRIDDLLQRNRLFEAMVKKDTALCTMLFPGQLLSLDEGQVLAGAMVMAASGASAYETMMVEIQCCVNVLASGT